MPWRRQLADIRVTEINEALIETFESEGDYVGLGVNLMIEAGSYVCIAASLFKNEEMTWTRNEAILGGLLVRLFKLIDALLDQTCKHRRETSVVLSRLIFECIVNLRYISVHASDDLFHSYRTYSLQHELKLLEKIEANIANRQGVGLPIEDRMIRSILASFAASALTRDEVAANRHRNWSGLNLYERARAVGLDQAYLAAFGGGSHSIHGNWQDLLEYHLEKIDDNSYRPNIHWHVPRPQILEALVILVADAVAEYVNFFTDNNAPEFIQRLGNLQDRTNHLSRLHEAFLIQRMAIA
ncbi:DUF5677 domain-containing protein [Methylobacillus sp.]|uniref:DUF5677 domain-containing protein n=1 Tax=Methylobacillus sp. TaxID=56818 RepID=UPI0012CE7AF8|nr:DUF5677 domain-containing protein [Methylobacillus sp.]MPS48839.1 hypothetical protein [Methylobacillus sp.]